MQRYREITIRSLLVGPPLTACRYYLDTMYTNICANQSHSTWGILNTGESSKFSFYFLKVLRKRE